jgi:hypothetical protein
VAPHVLSTFSNKLERFLSLYIRNISVSHRDKHSSLILQIVTYQPEKIYFYFLTKKKKKKLKKQIGTYKKVPTQHNDV